MAVAIVTKEPVSSGTPYLDKFVSIGREALLEPPVGSAPVLILQNFGDEDGRQNGPHLAGRNALRRRERRRCCCPRPRSRFPERSEMT
ncbi:hypothetical protein GN956_G2762 [Arapaima gigas]